jgi:ABC-type multidrug transport system fused ATPase/permease subunit
LLKTVDQRLASIHGRPPSYNLTPTTPPKKTSSQRLRDVWPDIREMIRSRRGILAAGLGLMVINRICGLVLPGSTKFLVDNVLNRHQYSLLGPLVLAVAGATIIQGFTSFSLTQLVSKSAQRLIAELRRKVQDHVGRLPVSYYDANKSGTLVARIMTDVEGVRNLLGTGLIDFVGGIFTALVALVILLFISPLMTGIALTVIILFSLVLRKAFKTIRPIFRERGKINAEVTGRLTESLGGVRVVKGYHAEDREAAVFAGGVQRLLNNVLKSLTAMSLLGMSATVLMGVVGALIMWVGAHQIEAHRITLGDFVTFTAYMAFMVAPVFQVVGIGTQLTEALAGLDRTHEVLSERPEDRDPNRKVDIPPIVGNVIFDNVTFAYDEGKTVLHGISFESAPGTVTALVGPSGSGKSTIIGLIAAFHTPSTGKISIDRYDLATVRLDSYRTQLGVVLQDTFLFDGNIRENVAFGKPDATEEEIMRACRIARVDEFAENFEKKYDTIVGERGVKLSGGQRQRVSIARAILADPRILILDEATSSLDSESEALIQEGLKYLMQGRTTFVIAHRLSTIRRANQILVVENGAVIEHGTHESLYAFRGRYYDLYTKQHGVEMNLFLAPGEGDSAVEDQASRPVSAGAGPGIGDILSGRPA